MTHELYEQVKDEIPNHIGVYIGGVCKKNAKKQFLSVEEYAKYNEDFKVGSGVLFMFTGPYMSPVEQKIQIRKDFLNWVINETSDTI